MMLVQLLYASIPSENHITSQSLADFLPTAIVKNKENDITGLLISSPSFYVQLIEGKREKINQLYNNISKDQRHSGIILLRYSEIREKEFSDWSMSHTTEQELLDSFVSSVVLPEKIALNTLTGAKTMSAMRRLAALLRVVDEKGIALKF
jgi:hypothetical protein